MSEPGQVQNEGQSSSRSGQVTFRPLTRDDFAMLHEWLQRPHVAEWWHDAPTTVDQVAEEFAPLMDPASSTRAYIALRDERAIGYIQSYVVLGSGDGWWEDEADPGARGIDQFLADASDLGQGLGTIMVRAFTDRLFEDADVTRIQVDPEATNARAIRCYEKAGFRAEKEVTTPDGRALLMIRERET